jgi:hypothetical protein
MSIFMADTKALLLSDENTTSGDASHPDKNLLANIELLHACQSGLRQMNLHVNAVLAVHHIDAGGRFGHDR